MNSSDFKRVVSDISGAVNSTSDCIIAKCESGVFSLSSSSQGLNIKSWCNCELDDFKFAVSYKRMSEVSKRVTGEITFKDGEIKSGKARFKIKALDPSLYHDPDSSEFKLSFTAATNAMNNLLKKASVFCDKDNAKPCFMGVGLNGGKLKASATNGNKLTVCNTDIDAPEFAVIIPSSSIRAIIACDGDTVKIDIGNCVRFSSGNRQVTTNRIDGVMPNIQAVLDSADGADYTVNKNDFLSAVDVAQSLSDKAFNQVKLVGCSGEITVSAVNGESSQVINYSGGDFEAAFSANMLMECISSCDGETLNITQGRMMRIIDNENTFCLAGVRL